MSGLFNFSHTNPSSELPRSIITLDSIRIVLNPSNVIAVTNRLSIISNFVSNNNYNLTKLKIFFSLTIAYQ
jgi:hypothetical protein